MSKYSLLIIRNFLGGVNSNMSKVAMAVVSMETFLLLRYIATIPFSLMGYREYKEDMLVLRNKPQYILMLGVPVIIGVTSSYCFYTGLDSLPASIALNMVSMFNIISCAIIGAVFFNEKKSVKYYLILLFLIPLFGMLMMNDELEITKEIVIGILCLLVSGISFALSLNINKKQLKYFSVQGTVVIKGVLALLLMGSIYLFNYRVTVEGLKELTILVIFIALFSSGVGTVATILEYKSIKFLDATTVMVFNLLGPIFTTIIAVLVFSESVSYLQVVSMVGIVIVIYFSTVEDNKNNKTINEK